MRRDASAYVEEILQAITDIESFISGMHFSSYARDERTKAAVERKLLVIGEALNQLCKTNPSVNEYVTDFKRIVGFRNILVHGYFGVEDQIVWDVVESKLSLLRIEMSSFQTIR